jgi:hypothetical protein
MFPKLRKPTVSFVKSVRTSVWDNSAPTEWIFAKFEVWVFFENLSRTIPITLQSDMSNGHFTWRPLWIYMSQFFLEWEILQANVVEKIETQILCAVTLFPKPYRLWNNAKNSVELGGPRITKKQIHIACCITETTNTHSELVIIIMFPQQQWLHESLSMLSYMFITCLLWYPYINISELHDANRAKL